MTIHSLKSVFEKIKDVDKWDLQVLRISSESSSTKYASRRIVLEPADELANTVRENATKYLDKDKEYLSKYVEVLDYDGTTDATRIYKLDSNNQLIAGQYTAFTDAIADPDVEADPTRFTSASVIIGSIPVNGEQCSVKLISIQKPFTHLKQKFLISSKFKIGGDITGGTYKKLDEDVLNLQNKWDVVIVRDEVYFFTMNGEKLFDMERSYRAVCNSTIEEIEHSGLISDSSMEAFKSAANRGHNPRRFVAFNRARFEALKDKEKRKQMADTFKIKLDDSGKFDANIEGAVDAIVKLLCNKGMVDPFENEAVEVFGAKPW